MKPTAILVDLNGTLLDLSVLDPDFARIFGSAEFRERWFEQLQVLWMTSIATGAFEPFEALARSALQMLARKEGIELRPEDESAIVQTMTTLPPYPDVPAALHRLKDAGHRLVALTNGPRKTALAQLAYAKIDDLFDDVYSADQVSRYKPAREPYCEVAEQLGARPRQLVMVAAHAWDLAGAAKVGMRTAFIARPRQVLNPRQPKPDLEAATLDELADQLTAQLV